MDHDVTLHIVAPKRTHFGDTRVEAETTLAHISENVHVHNLGTARDTFWHYFYFQLACRKYVPDLVKKHDIDIIHSQNTMPDLFLSPKRLGVPIVTTIHTMERERLPAVRRAAAASGIRLSNLERSEKLSLALGGVLYAAERAYYGNGRHYIAVSQWTKKQVLRHQTVDPGRIRVIHNGVNCDVFTPHNANTAKELFPDLASIETPKILFLSRITASKGAFILFKAISRVLEEVDAQFIFVGPGQRLPERDQDNVWELGYVPHYVTPHLYALADIFILPSFYENFPLSVLEAMASGRAVIASNVGGIPEAINHRQNGFLIERGSVEDIVDAITTLVRDDALRTKLGDNARKTVETRFGWERTATEVLDYYASVQDEGSLS
jgi:glycosyltransferase involved in cell wall biosynthesis